MGKIFDMSKNLHLKESKSIPQFSFIENELQPELMKDIRKFAERALELEMDKLTSPIFMRVFGSGTQTATSINSRMETIIEGETRKAEIKLIEYKPTWKGN